MFLWRQVTPFYWLEKGRMCIATCLMRITFAFNLLAWEAGTARDSLGLQRCLWSIMDTEAAQVNIHVTCIPVYMVES